MTDSIDKLTPEYPRRVRGRVDQLAEDMAGVKHCMASLETEMAPAKRDVAVAADRANVVLEALSDLDDGFVSLLEEGRRALPPMQDREPL